MSHTAFKSASYVEDFPLALNYTHASPTCRAKRVPAEEREWGHLSEYDYRGLEIVQGDNPNGYWGAWWCCGMTTSTLKNMKIEIDLWMNLTDVQYEALSYQPYVITIARKKERGEDV